MEIDTKYIAEMILLSYDAARKAAGIDLENDELLTEFINELHACFPRGNYITEVSLIEETINKYRGL